LSEYQNVAVVAPLREIGRRFTQRRDVRNGEATELRGQVRSQMEFGSDGKIAPNRFGKRLYKGGAHARKVLMKNGRLKYLNPFYFENRYLLWTVFINTLLAMILLVQVYSLAFVYGPSFLAIGSHTPVSSINVQTDWNVVQLRKMLLTEDCFNHLIFRDIAQVSKYLAFTLCDIVALLLLNALYFYKAYRLLKSSVKAGSEVVS
jgi:hypothetical protein